MWQWLPVLCFWLHDVCTSDAFLFFPSFSGHPLLPTHLRTPPQFRSLSTSPRTQWVTPRLVRTDSSTTFLTRPPVTMVTFTRSRYHFLSAAPHRVSNDWSSHRVPQAWHKIELQVCRSWNLSFCFVWTRLTVGPTHLLFDIRSFWYWMQHITT